jgi:hypothetical protein
VRVFPYWAFPMGLMALELGVAYRRKRRFLQYLFWGSAIVDLFFFVCWFMYRGDLNSERWIHYCLQNFSAL